MGEGVELYKAFIDGLVDQKDGVLGTWILGDGYPKTDDNKAINELLSSVTDEQKAIIAKMVTDARIGGIHDTLAYINEQMDCEGLQLVQDGEVLPYDTFEGLNFDFTCRCEGDDWPE